MDELEVKETHTQKWLSSSQKHVESQTLEKPDERGDKVTIGKEMEKVRGQMREGMRGRGYLYQRNWQIARKTVKKHFDLGL